jgi:hypothetical protein
VAQKFRSGGRRHGVTYTPTATLGVLPAVGVCPVYADGHPRRTAGRRRIPCMVLPPFQNIRCFRFVNQMYLDTF